MRIPACHWGWTVMLLCLALLLWSGVFAFPVSGSLPKGLYLRVPYRKVQVGRIYEFCLGKSAASFALGRGYLRQGRCPSGVIGLGKYVLAREADSVSGGPDGLWVNGGVIPGTRPKSKDSAGRTMSVWSGAKVLKRGEYLIGIPRHKLSFDSRYFGPVGEPESRLIPIITAGMFE